MRRLAVALALAAAAVAAIVLQAHEPATPRGSPPRMEPPPEAALAPAPPEEHQGVRVTVRDAEGVPLAGARCEVEAWGAGGGTGADGVVRFEARAGVPAEATVRASRDGYRPAARRGRLLALRAVELKLLRAPEVRVFGRGGQRIADFSWDRPGADLRERRLLAPGHLPLDLARVPREMLAAWDDLLARAPVDVFLVPEAGLPCAVLTVRHPDGADAAVRIDAAPARLPDLGAFPRDWQALHAAQWPPRPPATARSGEPFRVYAERRVAVTVLAAGCRPLRAELDAPAERTLALEREAWAEQRIVVTDRFGREGPLAASLVDPLPFPLALRGSTLRVPHGDGPYTIEVDGGPRGRAVRTVAALPSEEPIRFELSGIEVRLRLVDDESGEPVEALALSLEGARGAILWNAEEGTYVFGPVDPGTIGVVHDPECRVDVRVDPLEAENGVLRRELRVRGFPRGVAPEPE